MVRDVDKLDKLPDSKIRDNDQQYLEKHKVDAMFGEVLDHLLMEKPPDPIQFIIDCLQFGPGEASQDKKTGLPVNRKTKLEAVFNVIDKTGSGRISFKMLQAYTNKFGGKTMKDDQLRAIFKDFRPEKDSLITKEEFFAFFSHTSRIITNADFETMIGHLMKA